MKTKKITLLSFLFLLLTFLGSAQNDSIIERKKADTISFEYKTIQGTSFNGANAARSEKLVGFYVGSHYIKNNISGRQELKKIILQEPLARNDFKTYQGWNGVKSTTGTIFFVSGGIFLGSYLIEDFSTNENIMVPIILGSGVTYFITNLISKKMFKKSIRTYNKVHR